MIIMKRRASIACPANFSMSRSTHAGVQMAQIKPRRQTTKMAKKLSLRKMKNTRNHGSMGCPLPTGNSTVNNENTKNAAKGADTGSRQTDSTASANRPPRERGKKFGVANDQALARFEERHPTCLLGDLY